MPTQQRPLLCMHLDLKGVMFKPSYLPRLLDDLQSQGCNAILLEYEDAFPFIGLDIAQDKSVVWPRAQVGRFARQAAMRGIEIIPLQQCLGHLEYLYRWKRYEKYALHKAYPSTLNLHDPQACAQIFAMLGQVIDAHPDSRYIHLGMDEARGMGKGADGDTLSEFLDHLEKLTVFCEARGKTPMIWTDMLEDHFRPGAFDHFCGRVVLVPWDYGTSGETTPIGRIAGFRLSRRWLDEPQRADGPAVNERHTYIEDMPAAVRKAVRPYLRGREFVSMFQADLWTKLGFEVVGAAAARDTSSLSVMCHYNRQFDNADAWAAAIRRTGQLGVIATSWARGTTWCPPGFNFDLVWPVVAHLTRAMCRWPQSFWRGLSTQTVQRLLRQLGRCRTDWRITARVADEMTALLPRISTHQHEWRSIVLMARVLDLHQRLAFVIDEVDYFHANTRPVSNEWKRRLADQKAGLAEIGSLRKKVRAHFGKRYFGDAFDEWIADLFDLHETRLRECQRICRTKLAAARKQYARHGRG